MVKFPRREVTGDVDSPSEEAYVTTQLYIAERANACSEFLSDAGTMTAIFDLSHQHRGASPPLSWQYKAIKLVQQLYPERLHQLIILEPPFWMRGVFSALKPFLSQQTRDKIQIVNSR